VEENHLPPNCRFAATLFCFGDDCTTVEGTLPYLHIKAVNFPHPLDIFNLLAYGHTGRKENISPSDPHSSIAEVLPPHLLEAIGGVPDAIEFICELFRIEADDLEASLPAFVPDEDEVEMQTAIGNWNSSDRKPIPGYQDELNIVLHIRCQKPKAHPPAGRSTSRESMYVQGSGVEQRSLSTPTNTMEGLLWSPKPRSSFFTISSDPLRRAGPIY
jgi:hypothetical protein